MFVRILGFFALLGLVAAVAGCGGGGSSSEGSTGAGRSGDEGGKAEFIKEADASCAKYHEEARPIEAGIEAIESSPNPESPANEKKLGGLLKEATVLAEGELEDVRALEAPRSDASTVDSMLGLAEEANAKATEAGDALEAGDIETFGEVAQDVQAANEKARRQAEDYGLKVCGREL